MSQFDPSQIPRSEFEENIAVLEERLSKQRAVCEQTERHLMWWRDGLALYGGDAPAEDGDAGVTHESEPNGKITELVPSGAVLSGEGARPTLRQGIVRVMLDGHRREWAAREILAALAEKGWMPHGKNAENTARDKITALVKQGMLRKVRYGTYALTPAARNGELFPEIT